MGLVVAFCWACKGYQTNTKSTDHPSAQTHGRIRKVVMFLWCRLKNPKVDLLLISAWVAAVMDKIPSFARSASLAS